MTYLFRKNPPEMASMLLCCHIVECMCMCMRMCVCTCVYAYVYVCVCVFETL